MVTPSVTCYFPTNHRKGRKIAEAFADGCGGGFTDSMGRLLTPTAAFYGMKPEMGPLWDQVRAAGVAWYYIDNGYFGRGRYYSVTRNAERHDGATGEPDFDRAAEFGLDPQPRRDNPRGHILLTLQSPPYYAMRGTTLEAFELDTVATLRKYTDAEIRVRGKPAVLRDAAVAFAEDLAGAWAVVTWSSMTALEAVLAGIPAIALKPCHLEPFCSADLATIEDPWLPPRDHVLRSCAILAANQWTVGEMRAGHCWDQVQAQANSFTDR